MEEEEFEEKLEESQKLSWKNDKDEIVLFFNRFNLDVRDVYEHVINIDYDRMQVICYLLSKIDKAIKICDFLDTLERRNHEDVDVIKIYILISHAEIASRNLKKKGTKLELVKIFFSPVEPQLKYRIVPNFPSNKMTFGINFTDILYKIRCEYTHEGNYTGRIFKKDDDGACSIIFRFNDGKEDLSGECGLTYKEFLNIYMIALIENIKIFSGFIYN